jgi:hypothetical protein
VRAGHLLRDLHRLGHEIVHAAAAETAAEDGLVDLALFREQARCGLATASRADSPFCVGTHASQRSSREQIAVVFIGSIGAWF